MEVKCTYIEVHYIYYIAQVVYRQKQSQHEKLKGAERTPCIQRPIASDILVAKR